MTLNDNLPMSFLIGTRGSQLALTQAEGVRAQIAALFKGGEIKLEVIKTLGDRLSAKEAIEDAKGEPVIGLFTRELDEALLSGKIRAAIHSLKDVPTELPKGIGLGALIKRADYRDALISQSKLKLSELPQGSRVGTSSPRREAQLKALRPDLSVLPLRGNVDTRLRKLAEGEFDAIVIAAAGLIRLGREKEITEFLSPDAILPAPAQGVLAVTIREDDVELLKTLKTLDDAPTGICAKAERSFLRTLQGGCRVPVGALASIDGERLWLKGVIAHTNGQQVLRFEREGLTAEPEKLGRDLAEFFLKNGAKEILDGFGRTSW
jgi:hydroxymethylbilane synthase